jgi:hypothetical protein
VVRKSTELVAATTRLSVWLGRQALMISKVTVISQYLALRYHVS